MFNKKIGKFITIFFISAMLFLGLGLLMISSGLSHTDGNVIEIFLLSPAEGEQVTNPVSFSANIKIDDGPEPSNVLIPGEGFTSMTGEPDPIGNPNDPGYDAKAIARWDVVPYQTFDGIFEIGVVAFHMNGIDRVEFSVDDGPWLAVREMTFNPRTGVVEYWAKLDASLFTDDSLAEVRAIVYPNIGEPRVLAGNLNTTSAANGEHSTYLYSNYQWTFNPGAVYVSLTGSDTNSGTESSPFATLGHALEVVPDGGEIILLDAGTYYLADRTITGHRMHEHWITIRPKEGLTREQVILASPGGQMRPRVFLNKIQGVTLDFESMGQFITNPNDFVWFHDTIWTYNDWTNEPFPTPVKEWFGGLYVTDSLAYEGEWGFNIGTLVRNSKAERISGDVFQNVKFVLNFEVKDVDGFVIYHHTDLLQWWGVQENIIIYGFNATENIQAQSVFLFPNPNIPNSFTNIAFVDVFIRNVVRPDGSISWQSQLAGNHSHVLFQNFRLNQLLLFRTTSPPPDTYIAENVVFKDCRIHDRSLDISQSIPNVKFINCLSEYPLHASTINESGGTTYEFLLAHNVFKPAISVTVVGPSGYNQSASVISSFNFGSQTMYTYSIPAPEGSWQAQHNGKYNILSHSPIDLGIIGTFHVDIS
jgi:hypothetical protein